MEIAHVQTAAPLDVKTQQNSAQTLSTLHDAETLSTVHDAEALTTLHDVETVLAKTHEAKKEEANPTGANFGVPDSSAKNFGTSPLSTKDNSVVEELDDGRIEENEGEVAQELEEAEAALNVSTEEDALEFTEDYQETLAAAINTAQHLEVDQPEILSGDSLETPTQEDLKMLNNKDQEVATVEEEETNVEDVKATN